MLTQTLQDLVVVPDGRGLIFTCSKVALQLKGKKGSSPRLEMDNKEEGHGSSGIKKVAEKTSQRMYLC